MVDGGREAGRRRVLARVAVLAFLVLWLGPGLLPGRRLTAACYLAVSAVWQSAAHASLALPLPVVPDQSCFLIDYPNLLLAHAALMEGGAPVTLPAGGGVPYLANPQAAPGSPWHLPAILTGSLYAHSWAWALRAALAAALGWVLARRLGLGAYARALVAVGSAAAGMMASQFLMTNPSPMMLLPLLVLLAEECAARRDWTSAVLFGGVAGLAPLWGHPEPAFLAVLGAGCWWAAREMAGRDWTARLLGSLGLRAVLAAGVCALVASPALAPFLAFLPRAVSYKLVPELSRAHVLGGLMVAVLGVAALVAFRKGADRQRLRRSLRTRGGILLLVVEAAVLVWISLLLDPYALTHPEAFPRGHALGLWDRIASPAYLQHLYPGLVLLAFVPEGWRRLRTWRPALGTMLVLGLGLGWALPPFDLLRLLPGLWTLTPSYAAPLLTLPLALLGAAGIEGMRDRPARLAAMAGVGAGAAALWQVSRALGVSPISWVMLEPRAVAVAAVGVCLVVALVALPRRAAALVLGLALVDLFLHAYPYARPMPAFDYPRTPAVEAVAGLLEEGGRFVAVTPDPAVPVPDVFPPNTGAAYGLADARMTGALRSRALMQRWEEVRLPDLHPNVLLAGEADARLWDDLGVRAVVTKPGTPVPGRYRLAYQDRFVQV